MRTGAVFSAVLVTLLGTTTVQAYVLPAEFLLRTVAEQRLRLKAQDISVQLSTTLDGQESPVEERLYLKRPERRRLVRPNVTQSAVWVFNEGAFASGTEQALAKTATEPPDLFTQLLMPVKSPDLDSVEAHLAGAVRAAGIDLETVSLRRNGEQILYVIGAKSWDDTPPQLWIEKETFRPVKLVLYPREGDARVRYEVRYLDWGSAVGGAWFPRVIESYKDGKLLRRAEAIDVQINQNLPETLFELPR